VVEKRSGSNVQEASTQMNQLNELTTLDDEDQLVAAGMGVDNVKRAAENTGPPSRFVGDPELERGRNA
jgi:hypothetical protein